MKKFLFLIVCLMVVGIQSVKAGTRAAVLLLHEGNGTTYEVSQLAQAVKEAADGDTLYLSAGLFQLTDTLKIEKAVSVIGQGQNTIIGGSIAIALEDNPMLTACMLDAFRILGDINVQKSVRGLKMRKVNISAGNLQFLANVESVEIDRCYIESFWSSQYLRSASIINSKIRNEGAETTDTRECDIVYQNCIIGTKFDWRSIGSKNHVATYFNSIICSVVVNGWSGDYGYIYNSSFINSLIFSKEQLAGDYHSEQNCYYQKNILNWDNENGCALSKEELLQAGYLGTDGTVVGIEGGNTPYTLTPNSINVNNAKLDVDMEKKVLNVTLKVAAN